MAEPRLGTKGNGQSSRTSPDDGDLLPGRGMAFGDDPGRHVVELVRERGAHQQREVHRAYRTPDAVGWPMIRTGLAMCWASRRCYTIRSHACYRIVIPEQER